MDYEKLFGAIFEAIRVDHPVKFLLPILLFRQILLEPIKTFEFKNKLALTKFKISKTDNRFQSVSPKNIDRTLKFDMLLTLLVSNSLKLLYRK